MSPRDYLQPWKLVTLFVGLGLLLAGSRHYQFQDWDVGISLIMGVMTYVFAPWSVRLLLKRQWRMIPLITILYWLTVDGVYVAYNEMRGHWYLREANFWASSALYWLCGVIWMPYGSLRNIVRC